MNLIISHVIVKDQDGQNIKQQNITLLNFIEAICTVSTALPLMNEIKQAANIRIIF